MNEEEEETYLEARRKLNHRHLSFQMRIFTRQPTHISTSSNSYADLAEK